MSISTESTIVRLPDEVKPVVLVLEGSFLVLDTEDGPGQEVIQTDEGLKCSCFIAQVSPDGACAHIQAVREYVSGSSLEVKFTQADADYYLGRVARLDAEIQKDRDSATVQIKRIEEWLQRQTEKLERRKSFYLLALQNWLYTEGLNSKRLVNGTIQFRKQPLQIEILDEELLRVDGRFQRTVPERIEIDRKALRQYVQQTGEEPEGVRVTVPGPKFSYKLEEGS